MTTLNHLPLKDQRSVRDALPSGAILKSAKLVTENNPWSRKGTKLTYIVITYEHGGKACLAKIKKRAIH